MKRPKFDDCEDRNQARFPERESCHRGTHRRALVWLLASALAVLGTAEALSAARHKSELSDRKKAAETEHHKSESPDHKKTADAEHHKPESSHRKKDKKAAEAERHKKAAEVGHHRHVIVQPAAGEAGGAAAAGSRRGEAGDRAGAPGQGEGRNRARRIDRRSGGGEARRMGTAAPLRQRSRFRPLRRLHPRQSRLAEHAAAAPARGGEAVAGAARRRHGAPLRRQGTDQRDRPACARARRDGRGRPRRRRERGSRGVAVGAIVGRNWKPRCSPHSPTC